GEYLIIVRDAAGCVATVMVEMFEATPPIIAEVEVEEPDCSGDNGVLTVVVEENDGMLYSIDDGMSFSDNPVFENLEAGFYPVVSLNTSGCIAKMLVELSTIEGPTVQSLGVIDASCEVNNGQISIGATTINPPVEYSVDGGDSFSSTGSFSNLEQGIYEVVIRDAGGCLAAVEVELSAISPPTFAEVFSENVSCDEVDGAIVLQGTGGTGVFTYSIDGGDSFTEQNSFLGLGSGMYDVVIRDFDGCEHTEEVELLQKEGPTLANITVVDASCSTFNGQISVGASSSNPPISYSVDGGDTFGSLGSFSGLQAGDYTLVVRDDSGCDAMELIEIIATDIPSEPVATPELEMCAGDDLDVAVEASMNLRWYFESLDAVPTMEQPDLSGLTVGTYQLFLTQFEEDCESDPTLVTVTVTDRPSAPIGQMMSYCVGDFAEELEADSDGLLFWYDSDDLTTAIPAPTPSTAVSGIRTWYVRQFNEVCFSELAPVTVTVWEKPEPPVVLEYEYCVGELVEPLAAEGDELEWYASFDASTPLLSTPSAITTSPGLQFFYVSQQVGDCRSDRSEVRVTVNQKASEPVVLDVAYCMGDVTEPLSASGDNLVWYASANSTVGTNVTPIPTSIEEGTQLYYLSSAPDGFCESERVEVEVQVTAAPIAPSTEVLVSCIGEEIDLLGTVSFDSGVLYWYSESTGGFADLNPPVINTDEAGSFFFYVSAATASCESERSQLLVQVRSAPTIVQAQNSVCSDDDETYIVYFEVPAEAGFEVSSDFGQQELMDNDLLAISGIPTGQSVEVSFVDPFGCLAKLSIDSPICDCSFVEVPPTQTAYTICVDDEIPTLSVDATDEMEVLWFNVQTGGFPVEPNNTSFQPPTAGTYYVEVYDINSACFSNVRTAITIEVYQDPMVETSAAICSGETFILPNGLTVSDGGQYVTTTVGPFGCDSTIITNLTVKSGSEGFDGLFLCEGESYELNDGTIVTESGEYDEMYLTPEGCDSVLHLQVTLIEDTYIVMPPAQICEGSSYDLQDGSSATESGVYIVNIGGQAGCPYEIEVEIEVLAKPVAGPDELVDVCVEDGIIEVDLESYLDETADLGGLWAPMSANAPAFVADGVILSDPALLGQVATYSYTAVGECGTDDAMITVSFKSCAFVCTDLDAGIIGGTYCTGQIVDLADLYTNNTTLGGEWTVNGELYTSQFIVLSQEGEMELSYTVFPPADDPAECTAVSSMAILIVELSPFAGNDNEIDICNDVITGETTVDLDELLSVSPTSGQWTIMSLGAPLLQDGNVFDGTGVEAGVYLYGFEVDETDNCEEDVAVITVTVEDCGFEPGTLIITTVCDEDPIENVQVLLVSPGPDGLLGTEDDFQMLAFSNDEGQVIFEDLVPGTYEYVASLPIGYEFVDGENPSTGSIVILAGLNEINLPACGQNVCESFEVFSTSICSPLGNSFELLMLWEGGDAGPSGYQITNNLTGVVFSNYQDQSVLFGPFALGLGYSYTVSVMDNPECSFLIESAAVDCVTTAVELLTFDGESKDAGNFLYWQTASEENSDFFSLQRSLDGNQFEEIARIDAAGFSNTTLNYDYLDEEIGSGWAYYRLDQYDFNGTFKQSNIVSLYRDRSSTGELSLAPNPVSTELTIGLETIENSELNWSVYDLSGRLINTGSESTLDEYTSWKLNVSSLPAGMYFLSV
ncbi:T9SS type A sorting domain-containing protein, partial [Chitinophagales bacterium]|nr:T9SS type A sorting domain-containing protein [Chitinophagales bacterium]